MSHDERWKPVRKGDIYCSPACGGGCTWEAYQLAHKRAEELCTELNKGDLEWVPQVWENLGWHYEAVSICKRFSVSNNCYGRMTRCSAYLNRPGSYDGRWVGEAPQVSPWKP